MEVGGVAFHRNPCDALDEGAIDARAGQDVLPERTSTTSPVAMPRRSASASEIPISRSGRWNWSSGTRSTW